MKKLDSNKSIKESIANNLNKSLIADLRYVTFKSLDLDFNFKLDFSFDIFTIHYQIKEELFESFS